MKKIVEFFQDAAGQFSSKRLFALACFVVAVVLAFRGRDIALIAAFLAPATAVLSVQAATGT
jgi:hypothetical protein